jgi:hypothetical protein
MSRRFDDPMDDTAAAALPMRERVPRAPLPPRAPARGGAPLGMTHEQLVEALRAIEGLVDLGSAAAPNFHFCARPFLHFHEQAAGIYADVRFGSGDFEPVWASTPEERQELLARVCDHVERLQSSRKTRRGKRSRRRDE